MNVRSFSLGMRNLGVPILALCLLMGTACHPCENEESAEHRSPEGAWKAVVFERGCGATVRPMFRCQYCHRLTVYPTGPETNLSSTTMAVVLPSNLYTLTGRRTILSGLLIRV